MSKQNKVNPGTYTQAGRLTPDDTARELKKQREVGSPPESGDMAEPRKRVTEKDKPQDEEDETGE
jgi:hypothetical protein